MFVAHVARDFKSTDAVCCKIMKGKQLLVSVLKTNREDGN